MSTGPHQNNGGDARAPPPGLKVLLASAGVDPVLPRKRTDNRSYHSRTRVSRISVVAGIGLDNYHHGHVTGDRRARLLYRARHHNYSEISFHSLRHSAVTMLKAVVAVQRCTAGKPVRSYEEKLCVTEHNVQHDTIPPCARACPNERPRRDKKIRPPIFTSGRKLV